MGLLSGIRVLESAQLFNGDTLGVLLGDLGADVIKIESPFRGDYLRNFLGQVTPHNSRAVAASEAVVSSAWIAATYQLNDDRIADRRSLPAPDGTTSAKYQFYCTSDNRYVPFCCIEPAFWENFCRLADRPDLIGDADTGPVDFAGHG